jgi:DNA-binding transcriptional MerR regulator
MSVSLGVTGKMGDVTDINGLTPRAVRYYEERGLITPHRDGQNRRRFDTSAREALQLIARFRASGLGIRDIREILRLFNSGQTAAWQSRAQSCLKRREVRLREELAALEAAQSWLRSGQTSDPRTST